MKLLLFVSTCFLLAFAKNPVSLFPENEKLPSTKDSIPGRTEHLDTIYCGRLEIPACIDSVLWNRYLDEKIKNISDTIDYTIPPGEYKIETVFLIEKNGMISNVQIRKGCGPDLDSLAKKIIENGPAWKPSTRNGRFTKTYKRQTLVFIIPENPDCKYRLKGSSIL